MGVRKGYTMLLRILCSYLWLSGLVSASTLPHRSVRRIHRARETADFRSKLEHLPGIEEHEDKVTQQRHAPGSSLALPSVGEELLLPARMRPPWSMHPGRFNLSTIPQAPLRYGVACFENASTRLRSTNPEDCQIVINHIILGYPNPMLPRTFGFNDEVDIDLRKNANKKWKYENCIIFVYNRDKEAVDTFSMVDVAARASRIVQECVIGTKYAFGGSSNVGSPMKYFHVALGGDPTYGPSDE